MASEQFLEQVKSLIQKNSGLAGKFVSPKTTTTTTSPFGGYVSDTNTNVTNLSGTTTMPDISNVTSSPVDSLNLSYTTPTNPDLGALSINNSYNALGETAAVNPIVPAPDINKNIISANENGASLLNNKVGSDKNWFSENKDMLNAGINIGMLGLGGLSYMQNKKVGDKQIDLLTQQINNNAQEMARRDNMVSQLSSGFGGKSAGGNL